MKIAHISTAYTGGAGIAAFRLHNGLRNNENIDSIFLQQYRTTSDDKSVYTILPDTSLLSRIKGRFERNPEALNHKNVPTYMSSSYEIATFPTTSYRIEKSNLINDADIINLHWVAEFINYPTFFKKIKKPIVWTLHDMNPFQGIFHYEEDAILNKEKLGRIDREVYLQKLKAIHKSNNIHIVCLCEWMKEKSENSEILGRYPHYIIPNGMPSSQFQGLNHLEEKEKINLNNGKKTLLFISSGLDIRRKGFDLLLQAINQIDPDKFNLLTVGGEEIDLIKKVNHRHYPQISDTQELNKLYTAADITIIPSREDNLPNVMIESFANGTPVMSFNNGGMAEHIKTGTNGVLITDISQEALSQNINDFLNNKYTFDRNIIRNYAKNTFSDTIQTEKYIELYKSILNK